MCAILRRKISLSNEPYLDLKIIFVVQVCIDSTSGENTRAMRGNAVGWYCHHKWDGNGMRWDGMG